MVENPYFKKKEDFTRFSPKSLFIVARLDGPDAVVAQRLATEAVEVERAGGPWGRAVIDLSGFYPLGDEWMRAASSRCGRHGSQGIYAKEDRQQDDRGAHLRDSKAAALDSWQGLFRRCRVD
jgi:uncharacterized protein (TIGR03790 family)